MLLGTMDDQKVHRVRGSMSWQGQMTGVAFCGHNGKITEAKGDVITCPKCAEEHRKMMLARLIPYDANYDTQR